MNPLRQAGFTLLELVMVIIIVALAAVPILGQFSGIAAGMTVDEELQTAAQLAQARAEEIFALRRDQGYPAVATGTTNEVLTGNYAGYTRSVSVTEPPAGTGCPVAATCKGVVVSVERGLSNRAAVSFILVAY